MQDYKISLFFKLFHNNFRLCSSRPKYTLPCSDNVKIQLHHYMYTYTHVNCEFTCIQLKMFQCLASIHTVRNLGKFNKYCFYDLNKKFSEKQNTTKKTNCLWPKGIAANSCWAKCEIFKSDLVARQNNRRKNHPEKFLLTPTIDDSIKFLNLRHRNKNQTKKNRSIMYVN